MIILKHCPRQYGRHKLTETRQAVVIVGGGIGGLGLVRSLAPARMPIFLIESSRSQPAVWSRHCRSIIIKTLSGRILVDGLIKLRAQLPLPPVLLLADEMAVLTVSEYRDELKPHFKLRLPSPETTRDLFDKQRFQRLAERAGWPVPRSVVVADVADAARLEAVRFPAVVKPVDKTAVHHGDIVRAALAPNRDAATNMCLRALQEGSTSIVQEWIEGPADSIYFCLFYRGANRQTVAMFTGQKLAIEPPSVGSTTFCRHAREAAAVLEPITEDILNATEYEGIGGMEYKWDSARNAYFIIEPTVGRIDWQGEIATLNGVNIPLSAYCYETTQSGSVPLPTSPVVWRSSYLDARHAKIGVPADHEIVDGVYRRNDPIPSLAQFSGRALSWLRAHVPLSS